MSVITSYCSDLRSVLACRTLCWGGFGHILTNRTLHVTFNGQLSSKQLLLFGVPQGSVLGPLLYVLYMYTVEIEQLILRHGLHIRQYADYSHVYTSVSVGEVRIAVHSFTVCVDDVNEWMRDCG